MQDECFRPHSICVFATRIAIGPFSSHCIRQWMGAACGSFMLGLNMDIKLWSPMIANPSINCNPACVGLLTMYVERTPKHHVLPYNNAVYERNDVDISERYSKDATFILLLYFIGFQFVVGINISGLVTLLRCTTHVRNWKIFIRTQGFQENAP